MPLFTGEFCHQCLEIKRFTGNGFPLVWYALKQSFISELVKIRWCAHYDSVALWLWDFQDCGEEEIGKVCASFIGRKIGYLRLCSMLARLITYLLRISISIVSNLCYFKLHVKHAMLKFILREQCNLNCTSLEVFLTIDLGVFFFYSAKLMYI